MTITWGQAEQALAAIKEHDSLCAKNEGREEVEVGSEKNALGREHSGYGWLTELFIRVLVDCPPLMDAARDVINRYEGRPQRQDFWLAKLLWDSAKGDIPGVPRWSAEYRPDMVNFEGMDFERIRKVIEGRGEK